MTMTLKVAVPQYPDDHPYGWETADERGDVSTGGSVPTFEDIPAGASWFMRPSEDVFVWMGGVSQVTVVDRFLDRDAAHAANDHLNIEAFCGLPLGHKFEDREIAPSYIYTLLAVVATPTTGPRPGTDRCHPSLRVRLTDDETRFLLVERAWLLGENGQTLDRVAP